MISYVYQDKSLNITKAIIDFSELKYPHKQRSPAQIGRTLRCSQGHIKVWMQWLVLGRIKPSTGSHTTLCQDSTHNASKQHYLHLSLVNKQITGVVWKHRFSSSVSELNQHNSALNFHVVQQDTNTHYSYSRNYCIFATKYPMRPPNAMDVLKFYWDLLYVESTMSQEEVLQRLPSVFTYSPTSLLRLLSQLWNQFPCCLTPHGLLSSHPQQLDERSTNPLQLKPAPPTQPCRHSVSTSSPSNRCISGHSGAQV